MAGRGQSPRAALPDQCVSHVNEEHDNFVYLDNDTHHSNALDLVYLNLARLLQSLSTMAMLLPRPAVDDVVRVVQRDNVAGLDNVTARAVVDNVARVVGVDNGVARPVVDESSSLDSVLGDVTARP